LRKQQAQAIRHAALKAAGELTQILDRSQNYVSPDEFAQLKKGITACIQLIEIEILSPIHVQFPELE
jgi:hypothetical protein